MHFIGFIMLQAAGALFAHGCVAEKKRENDALRSFCVMIEQMQGLLETEGLPMPELLKILSERCEGEAKTFVSSLSASLGELGTCSFQELWQRALSEKTSIMEKSAVRELAELGKRLGRYDLQSQLDMLAACQKTMRQILEKRQSEESGDIHVTVGLIISASLLLGILLI